jgi:hypothetical protein
MKFLTLLLGRRVLATQIRLLAQIQKGPEAEAHPMFGALQTISLLLLLAVEAAHRVTAALLALMASLELMLQLQLLVLLLFKTTALAEQMATGGFLKVGLFELAQARAFLQMVLGAGMEKMVFLLLMEA